MVLYVYVLQIVDLFITDDIHTVDSMQLKFLLFYWLHGGFFFINEIFLLLMVFGLHYMINEKSQYHLILTEGKQVLLYKYRNIPNPAMVLTRTS